MTANNLDSVYNDFDELITKLKKDNELSASTSIETTVSKLIIVSAASFFESDIKDAIFSIYTDTKSRNLVEKLLDRNFWNMFDSKFESMNRFLNNFGDEFRIEFQKSIQGNQTLEDSAIAFLRLLQLRGEIVHMNFLSHSIDVTYQESYEIYKQSLDYVEYLKKKIIERK